MHNAVTAHGASAGRAWQMVAGIATVRALGGIAGVLIALSLCFTEVASAQVANPPAGGGAVVTPAEIQRMFDSYALMQAQDQLKISDEQFPQFLTRFKALQDIRRQGLQERMRHLQELRRQLNSPQPDDAVIREQLKAVQDLDMRLQADIKKAYDAIDQVLNLRQQAKFRVFEDNMERRKLELVTRARQANRPKL